MLEYVFFHKDFAGEFTLRLTQQSVPYRTKEDALGLVVSVPDDLDDDRLDELDAFYEALLIKAEALLNAEAGASEKQSAAIDISLRDGRVVQASVRPELMNKLLSAITFEELNELVGVIVDSIENPDDRPFCQR